jgi:hypothetical protein
MKMQHEIEALRENLLANTSIFIASQQQVGGLNGLIRQGLEHKSRKMRIAVLNEWAGEAVKRITGETLTSGSDLTSSMATMIINLLLEPDSTPWRLSAYGRRLIEETEKIILKRMGIEQLEIEL